jgi:hypothetical protein
MEKAAITEGNNERSCSRIFSTEINSSNKEKTCGVVIAVKHLHQVKVSVYCAAFSE